MRVTSAFSRLLDLSGVWVRSVSFEPGRVVRHVALRRRRLHCPKCSYSTRDRENRQHHDSVWRHLDFGRLAAGGSRPSRRLRCPEHGVHVEGVPFARDGARFTRDFEDLVAWLATKTDKTATCRLTRIDWQTIGRIIERVGDELLCEDRLTDLFEVSIDEIAWRKGHRYLTLIGDHRRRCVVWGCEGKGQAAADEFFAELDRRHAPRPAHPTRPRRRPRAGDHGPVRPLPDRAGRRGHPGRVDHRRHRNRRRDLRARLAADGGLDGHDRRLRQEVRSHAPQAAI